MADMTPRIHPEYPVRHKGARRLAPRLLLLALNGLAAGLVAGCKEDQIEHYRVAKPEATRLLGAIVPHEKQVWFLKMAGPAFEVEKHRDQFDQFLASIRFVDAAKTPITWTVPEGWVKEPDSPARYASFQLGTEDNPLTLTVSKFDRVGEAASVLANVNRWRGQIELQPIGEAELGACCQERKLEAGAATVVDLNSRMSSTEPAKAPKRPPLKYDMPDGWKKTKLPEFAIAAFETGDGAEVSISPLSDKGGGLVANVNRWRELQLGLKHADEEQIRKDLVAIEVGGIAGKYLDLTGAETPGKERPRILGAIVEQGDRTWFFKMRGPATAVGKQKATFETFLKSVRFDAGAGGNNG
jgi:hypothetical protein